MYFLPVNQTASIELCITLSNAFQLSIFPSKMLRTGKTSFDILHYTRFMIETPFIRALNKIIEFTFYAIFFLVPIVIHGQTFELFEFNKMWLTFGFALLIAFLWIAKILATSKVTFQRTILDIPIALFLISQIISTIFSIDPHTSFWGYYSRFNGGLLSILCYIFLYYAYATHLSVSDKNGEKKYSVRLIVVTLLSGTIVALWGFPSHFGYDPTCLYFRGTLDVSCWTESFQPTIRIFSTLGQPNWLAAYLAVLLPILLALPFSFFAKITTKKVNVQYVLLGVFVLTAILLYIDILFTRSQSGFIATWIGLGVFGALTGFTVWRQKDALAHTKKSVFVKFFGALAISVLLFTFIIGTPIKALQLFSLESLQKSTAKPSIQIDSEKSNSEAPASTGELGGTDSGKIRLIVWRGALDVFKSYPLFGSGVETFAFAYYKVKPIEHNLTSEWDFLYNKAHNEYLNYLATTGIVGLGTYVLFIGWFLYKSIKKVLQNDIPQHTFLITGLIGGFTSILISNFFGFSVVIVNLFLFIIPILVFDLGGFGFGNLKIWKLGKSANKAPETSKTKIVHEESGVGGMQMIGIIIVGIIVLYLELILLRYWIADQHYAKGSNLNKYAGVQGYIDAQEPLTQAVEIRPTENLYKNELSVNLATIALIAQEQKASTQAAAFAERAALLSDEVIAENPNNVVYFKTRTRVYYALSQLKPEYFQKALEAIEKSEELAPTDAKILYNKALLYGQAGDRMKAIDVLTQTIALKPNYVDAYQARALMYNQEAADVAKTNTVQAESLKTKARGDLQHILDKLDPKSKTIIDLLDSIK